MRPMNVALIVLTWILIYFFANRAKQGNVGETQRLVPGKCPVQDGREQEGRETQDRRDPVRYRGILPTAQCRLRLKQNKFIFTISNQKLRDKL